MHDEKYILENTFTRATYIRKKYQWKKRADKVTTMIDHWWEQIDAFYRFDRYDERKFSFNEIHNIYMKLKSEKKVKKICRIGTNDENKISS